MDCPRCSATVTDGATQCGTCGLALGDASGWARPGATQGDAPTVRDGDDAAGASVSPTMVDRTVSSSPAPSADAWTPPGDAGSPSPPASAPGPPTPPPTRPPPITPAPG